MAKLRDWATAYSPLHVASCRSSPDHAAKVGVVITTKTTHSLLHLHLSPLESRVRIRHSKGKNVDKHYIAS